MIIQVKNQIVTLKKLTIVKYGQTLHTLIASKVNLKLFYEGDVKNRKLVKIFFQQDQIVTESVSKTKVFLHVIFHFDIFLF